MESIRIIHDEHRSLAAVLHGMLYLVREIRLRGMKPPFDVLGAMVYYIDAFPERFHHPKEDRYLFRFLRARYPAAAPLIERPQTERRAGAEKIRILEQALHRYREGGADQLRAFAEAVQTYAAFHWDHMRAEEDELLPRRTSTGRWRPGRRSASSTRRITRACSCITAARRWCSSTSRPACTAW